MRTAFTTCTKLTNEKPSFYNLNSLPSGIIFMNPHENYSHHVTSPWQPTWHNARDIPHVTYPTWHTDIPHVTLAVRLAAAPPILSRMIYQTFPLLISSLINAGGQAMVQGGTWTGLLFQYTSSNLIWFKRDILLFTSNNATNNHLSQDLCFNDFQIFSTQQWLAVIVAVQNDRFKTFERVIFCGYLKERA